MMMEDDNNITFEQHHEEVEDGDSDNLHPLFMDRLPCHFANNHGLSAIATLLGDDDAGQTKVREDHERKKTNPVRPKKTTKGGRPYSIRTRKKATKKYYSSTETAKPASYVKRREKPPNKDKRKPKQEMAIDEATPNDNNINVSATTVSEAQLFLNMWKL